MIEGLEFNEERHEYRHRGRVVPSVTQVLSPLYDFSRVDPEVLARKAAIGTAVHRACELLDRGERLDPDSIDPEVAPYVVQYAGFHDAMRPRVLANEQQVYHAGLGYAGTLDRVYDIGGETLVVDLKTTAAAEPAHGVQLAAYDAALPAGGKPRRRAVLLLHPHEWRIKEFSGADDWPVYVSLLTLHRWRAKNAG